MDRRASPVHLSLYPLSLVIAITACGYTVRPRTAHGSLHLGRVTVRDPDALLAADARAVIARALVSAGYTLSTAGPVVDIEVSAPPDDVLPSVLSLTPTGAQATDLRAWVHLRARWTVDGLPHEATADAPAEAPVGANARGVVEASRLARRFGIEHAAQRLADTLTDIGP